MLMIDDLANGWVDINGNGKKDQGEVWGWAEDHRISPVWFLRENVLKEFPYVKTTYFVPVNRVPETSDYQMKAHFGPINETPEMAEFFHSAAQSSDCEMAYHGLSHGISGNKNRRFIQEWESYQSLEQALFTIDRGKKLFRDVFGFSPLGGKYCGYRKNSFSDESIDKSGFLWWCRDWAGRQSDYEDADELKDKHELKYFGDSRVIDMPSNIAGSMMNYHSQGRLKTAIKKMLGKRVITPDEVFGAGYSKLDELIKNRSVISIQEHSSPARTDGKRQTPNIYDDAESLKRIFAYLKDKNLWYATGTQIASYFELYNRTEIKTIDECSFSIKYTGRKLKYDLISVVITANHDVENLVLPNGKKICVAGQGNERIFIPALPVMDGIYQLEEKYSHAYTD